MCTSAPKAPPPVAPRQAPRLPDTAEISQQNTDALRRRSLISNMVFTAPSLAPAQTAGQTTLGA